MNNFDKNIKMAFTHIENPPETVNSRILYYRKTERITKMKKKANFRRVFTTAAMILLRAVPVYRAAKFLMPAQVAEKSNDFKLAAAFESENAIVINETQQSGGYDITLMGIVSGKNISDNIKTENNELNLGSTYCVVAIEKSDGTKFNDIMDAPEMFVSPYIKGNHPNIVNVASLNGGFFDIVEDGIMYRLMDCSSIEVFASTQVYLGVADGMLNMRAFSYNEKDGTVYPNPDYDGVKALFNLPLDTSKADPDKALEVIQSIVEH